MAAVLSLFDDVVDYDTGLSSVRDYLLHMEPSARSEFERNIKEVSELPDLQYYILFASVIPPQGLTYRSEAAIETTDRLEAVRREVKEHIIPDVLKVLQEISQQGLEK